jgi:endonuclease/exonuclease/phosphatase family metal-dependent hydrolase
MQNELNQLIPQSSKQQLDVFQLATRYRDICTIMYTPPPPRHPNSIRIVTYNLHQMSPYMGMGSWSGMKLALMGLDADVLCLQEVPDPTPFFKDSKFKHIIYDPVEFTFGNAICSSLPLQDTFMNKYIDGDRGFMGGTVVSPDNSLRIRIYNTHLDVFDESGSKRLREVSELNAFVDRDMQTSRRNSVSSVGSNNSGSGKFAPITVSSRRNSNAGGGTIVADAAILVGDFNAVDETSHLVGQWEWLKSHDAKRRVQLRDDVMRKVLHEFEWQDVFDNKIAPKPCISCWSLRRVDYILKKKVSGDDIKIVPFAYYDSSSDHIPLCVDIWRERKV